RAELDTLLDAAEADGVPDFAAAILPLENLADRLHQVWSPVSHLHAVTNSPELRAVYNDCLPELARYQTEIGQNQRLFRLYAQVAAGTPAEPAARSLLEHALRDFRLSGVHLPDDEKRRFGEAMEELTQLQAKFEQNVLDAMAAWTHIETDRAKLDGIPDTVLEQADATARAAGVEGWLLRLDQPTYLAVLTHAENRDLRYRFYRAWSTRASDRATTPENGLVDEAAAPPGDFDNSQVIEAILALRHETAALVGYENFSAYSLESKMAGSVAEAQEFLEDLGRKSHHTALAELEELERFAGQGLAAWDIAFYSERLRHERFTVSDEQLRPYFPLTRVLSGLFAVVEKIYGVTVQPIANVDAWHSDVRFYRLFDEDGAELGGFYTDLFARPNKRAGAWMDDCISRKLIDKSLQLPVAHLVCNFAAPTQSTPCLLTHNDVLTLFHEFGHTLHHLLTRVDYPSVAGISGVPWDAVELPSQFMENFAWEPAVVTMISGHYETGAPLPENILDRLRASRVFQAGLQMARQLEYSLFDLRLHAEYDPREGAGLSALLDDVRKTVAVIRQPDFNRYPHAFSHIFGGGYAAGYYSYKWAEVLAADAWSAFETHGIFDRDIANRFRRTILEIGGTRQIADAFAEFRGRAPSIEPLLAQSGIAPDGACDGPAA
ncbi:MAG: M3 family peptidase, partial [Gammaproteobacteria bacterium]